jgi:hypothetical protein
MARSFTADTHRCEHTTANVRGTVGTIACWIKPNWSSGDGAWHWFYELGDSFGERYPFLRHGIDNSLLGGFLSVGDINVADTGLFTSGTWVNFILTWDTTVRVELFKDAVSIGSNTGPTVPAAQPGITIGNVQPSHSAQNANCTITEWAMWDRVLDSTERGHLATDKWSAGLIPSGLVVYYKLKDNVDPEPDEVGSLDLTVTGAGYSSDDPGIVYSVASSSGRVVGANLIGSKLARAGVLIG